MNKEFTKTSFYNEYFKSLLKTESIIFIVLVCNL